MNDNLSKIQKELLAYSPPGNFQKVKNNLEILSDSPIPKIFEEALAYHEKQLTSCFLDPEKQDRYLKWQEAGGNTIPNRSKYPEFGRNNGDALISPIGHVKNTKNTFYCPFSDKKFDFDPLTEKVSNIVENKDKKLKPATAEPLRKILNTHIKKYCFEHYTLGVAAVYTFIDKDLIQAENDVKNGQFYNIFLDGHDFKPKSMIMSKWRSSWKLKISKIDNSVLLKGEIEGHIHAYELGNVQLAIKKVYPYAKIDNTTVSDDFEKVAENVVKSISAFENEYQKFVDETMDDLDTGMFKDLRRRVPISGPLNWNNFVAHYV